MNKSNVLFIDIMNKGNNSQIQEAIKELIKNNESMIILDSKEEYKDLFNETDYEVKIISLRNANDSIHFNPFDYAKEEYEKNNIDKSINIIKDIFANIFIIPENRDPFWERTASDFVTAIALYLLKLGKDLNFKEIIRVLKEGKEEFKNYVDSTDILDTINLLASPTIYAPAETKGGIISVAENKLNLIGAYPTLLEGLCGKDVIELKDKKQAIIIVNFDEKREINCLATVILTQLISKLYDLKINYNLVLDNYESLHNKDYFERIFATCNARNIYSIVSVRNEKEIKFINNFRSTIKPVRK